MAASVSIEQTKVEDFLDRYTDIGFEVPETSTWEQYLSYFQIGAKSKDFKIILSQLLQNLTTLFPNSTINIPNENEQDNKFVSEISHACHSFGISTKQHSFVKFPETLELLDEIIALIQTERILLCRGFVPIGMDVDVSSENKQTSNLSNQIKAVSTSLGLNSQTNNTSQIQELNSFVSKLPKRQTKFLLESRSFNQQQMKLLEEMNADMKQEYLQRRLVLVKRCSVTLQAFLWSTKATEFAGEMRQAVQGKLDTCAFYGDLELIDLFNSDDDLLVLEKTGGKKFVSGTNSALKKLIISQVPDRGGRVLERMKGDMPAFKPRESVGDNPNQNQNQNQQQQQRKQQQRVQGGWQQKNKQTQGTNDNDVQMDDADDTVSKSGNKRGHTNQRGGGGWNKKQRGGGGWNQ